MLLKIVLNIKESIPKTVMDVVPSAPIGDFKNKQQDSNAVLFRCRDRFPNGPFEEWTLHYKGPYPPRALLMVFSTTQLKHSIT